MSEDMPVYPPVLPGTYTGEERRKDRIKESELLHLLHMKIDALHVKLHQHMTEESVQLAEEIKKLMDSAFPFSDPYGHKRAHEAQIEKAAARAEFWRKMSFELAKLGLLGFVGWAAMRLWEAAVQGPK